MKTPSAVQIYGLLYIHLYLHHLRVYLLLTPHWGGNNKVCNVVCNVYYELTV